MPRRLTILTLAAAAVAFAQSPEQRAGAMLRRMTLDEKIGQLTQIGGLPLIPDPVSIDERVCKGQAGSILWLPDPALINRLQNIAVEETRLKILRARCDPRVPHGVSRAAGDGRFLGHGSHRARPNGLGA